MVQITRQDLERFFCKEPEINAEMAISIIGKQMSVADLCELGIKLVKYQTQFEPNVYPSPTSMEVSYQKAQDIIKFLDESQLSQTEIIDLWNNSQTFQKNFRPVLDILKRVYKAFNMPLLTDYLLLKDQFPEMQFSSHNFLGSLLTPFQMSFMHLVHTNHFVSEEEMSYVRLYSILNILYLRFDEDEFCEYTVKLCNWAINKIYQKAFPNQQFDSSPLFDKTQLKDLVRYVHDHFYELMDVFGKRHKPFLKKHPILMILTYSASNLFSDYKRMSKKIQSNAPLRVIALYKIFTARDVSLSSKNQRGVQRMLKDLKVKNIDQITIDNFIQML